MGEEKSQNDLLESLKRAAQRRPRRPVVFHSEVGERLFDEGRKAVAMKLDAQMHPESDPLPEEEEAE